ncbi:MAG TPA: cell division protein SepF [Candidatus Corynebacterium gallistercoris]|uniref:Cell division protein SepF n=1 Tax=Candidatus Corynebacterium gallistercoris TaxID=2838530 RepID=A0A9D1UR20_9CORY|nr:cell division protein SepF [Candidatus Corynebacterium gallistercoris]
MGNSQMDKIKEFFGFGAVEQYNDSYTEDNYRDERGGYAPYRNDSRGERGELREDRYAPRGSRYSSSDATPPARSRYESAGAGRMVEPAQPSYTAMTLGNYTQAGNLAEELKKGDIVAFSLSGMEKGEATRVLDFAAGLSRGLDAQLKKLKGVRNFVLIPAGVTLEQDQLDAVAEDL